MKRYGNLWDSQIATYWNVENAIQKVVKPKRHKRGQPARYSRQQKYVLSHREECVKKITEMLAKRTYQFGRVRHFTIWEGHKDREINHLQCYPDSIMCQAVMNVCQPLFIEKYISTTYSSIKGRGLQECVVKIEKVLRTHKDWYVLQIDVRKCYESIDHKICMDELRKVFKDIYVLEFFERLLGLLPHGIAIGFSPNHYLANLMFNPVDHYMKEVERLPYYFRYMDDIFVVLPTKAECFRILGLLKGLLTKQGFSIKNNIRISPVRAGLDFCGYKFFGTHTLLRKRIKIAMKRKHRRLIKQKVSDEVYKLQMASYYGWCKWANCRNLLRKTFGDKLELFEGKGPKKQFVSNENSASYKYIRNGRTYCINDNVAWEDY